MPSVLFTGETPSSVMFADLKNFGGLANKDAAQILLSSKVSFGGRSPRSRVDNRTFLSREVVHVNPQDVNRALYADFTQSAQILTGRLSSNLGGGDAARNAIVEHYGGVAATAMRASLDTYGIDGAVYSNEVRRLVAAKLRAANDRPVLLVMLFVATGCLAAPEEAVRLVEAFAQSHLASDILTVNSSASGQRGASGDFGEKHLGLIRLVDGTVRPPLYPLSTGPQGTVIGSTASGSSINDVDYDVSRNHLRIWKEGGLWYCQGMGSTNGTGLIRAKDGSFVVVEPPRKDRGAEQWPPVQLRDSDTLCLGGTTRFLVMQIQG